MRFDDRLKTVLEAPVANAHDRAVRWRQLIDLLSRVRGDADPLLIGRAIQAARDDRLSVPDAVRAATARAIAGRPLDHRIIALFASDKLEVAAPVLAGATLDAEARAEVNASASEEVRRFFFALEGQATPAGMAPGELDEALELDTRVPSIGEVVARIERLRQQRGEAAAPAEAEDAEVPAESRPPGPELAEPQLAEPALFRWESDPAGAIAWVDGAPRAALIGRALAGHPAEALLDESCREIIARRSPFADVPLASAEPLPGEWKVSGAPAFAQGDGRFIGYRGIARRVDAAAVAAAPAGRSPQGADSLRELIHEIKTPLNAIIGFAEIIDGQYLGPAHRRYRDRAGEILGQARALLAAIEDLDFAAKLQSSRGSGGTGTEFGEIFPRMTEELNRYGAERGVGMLFRLKGRFHRCALPPDLSERLVRRFVQALMDASEPGETLDVEVAPIRGHCGLAVLRPMTLRGATAEELLDPAFAGPVEEGRIGVGFALRLVRGLVRIGGGDLIIDPERFTLLVPAGR